MGDINMNNKYKRYIVKAVRSFQIIQNNKSYIFVRGRIYNCFYDKYNYILLDGKDNEIIVSKDEIDKYFRIIG